MTFSEITPYFGMVLAIILLTGDVQTLIFESNDARLFLEHAFRVIADYLLAAYCAKSVGNMRTIAVAAER